MLKRDREARRRTATARAGFTLLEIMVALAIFAIAMMGVVALFMTIFRHNQSTADTRLLYKAAEEVMEIVMTSHEQKLLEQNPDWAGWVGSWNYETDVNVKQKYRPTLDHKDVHPFLDTVKVTDITPGGYAAYSLLQIEVTVRSTSRLDPDPQKAKLATTLNPGTVWLTSWLSTR